MIFDKYENVEEFVSLKVFEESKKIYNKIFKHKTLYVTPTFRETIQFEYEYLNYYIEFEIDDQNINYYSNINGIEIETIVTEEELLIIVDDYIEFLQKEGII